MAKLVNVNFHQTFKPESQYISSILNVADGESQLSIKDISSLTGIPQGKSSGKVEPHILYANYMGLIDYEKKNGQIKLKKTPLGEIVSIEDPGLQEPLTKLLLHVMMLRKDEGVSVWSIIFKKILPKYRSGIKKDMLLLELNQIYDGKISAKNIAPFYGSYDDLFSELNLITIADEIIMVKPLVYDKEFIFLYALGLWEYWDEKFAHQEEISSLQFEELNYGKSFGWDVQNEYKILEHLADRGLIRMNRQLMPYTILRLADKQELISRLYSELC